MWPIIVEIPLPFPVFGSDHLPVRGFGLMLVAALLVGNWTTLRLGRKSGIADEVMNNLFLWLVFAIVIGARLLYVIVNWQNYSGDIWSIFKVHQGGMVFYGSFFGVVATLYFFSRHYKLPMLQIYDICAVASAIGIGIGRIGCLLVGDDYGRVCSPEFPIGIKFPSTFAAGSLWGLEIPAGNGNLAGAMQGEWLHPTQVYMSLNGFLMYMVLSWCWTRRRFHGQVTALFCMLYAVNRSCIEVFRGDEDRGFVGPFSTSQFISIFVFLAGVLLYVLASRRRLEDRTQLNA